MTLEDAQRRISLRSSAENFRRRAALLGKIKETLFIEYFIEGIAMYELATKYSVHEGTISRRLKRIVKEVRGDITNRSDWRKQAIS
jgi:DNA-directed RNA polymerase specialized sigma24 family protein